MTHVDSIMIRASVHGAFHSRMAYESAYWGVDPATNYDGLPKFVSSWPFKKTKVFPGPLPIDTSRDYCRDESWTFMKFSTMVRWQHDSRG